jgi:hypothetical protein
MDQVEVDIDYEYYAQCVDKIVDFALESEVLEYKTAGAYVKQVNDALKRNGADNAG